jgi:hypothetical protein
VAECRAAALTLAISAVNVVGVSPVFTVAADSNNSSVVPVGRRADGSGRATQVIGHVSLRLRR